MASITSIVYQPEDMRYDGPHSGDYHRMPAERVTLVADFGIAGDLKAGKQSDRQLNLISQEWLAKVAPLGYKTAPGEFGEQIIVSGLAVETLPVGVRLWLGEDACVEVTSARTGCSRLQDVQGKTIEGLGALGVMAKVISGGAVAVGDPVRVEETQQA